VFEKVLGSEHPHTVSCREGLDDLLLQINRDGDNLETRRRKECMIQ